MKVTNVHQEIGTMHGHRGITFLFETATGGKRVTFDFYGNGSAYDGAPYNRIEAAALHAMVAAGHKVIGYTHRLIT